MLGLEESADPNSSWKYEKIRELLNEGRLGYRIAAVVLTSIRHKYLPFMHNLAYELTATNAAYLAWDIAEEDSFYQPNS